MLDGVPFHWSKTATGACVHLRRLEERAACALLGERLLGFRLRLLPLAAVVERLVVDIGDETQTNVIVGMIEDQAVVLAVRRSKTAPNHLNEEDLRPGGPGEDDAPDVPVDADRQTPDVADDLDVPGMEPARDLIALGRVGVAVDVTCWNAGFLELGL